jgi:hypothetical protein
MPIRRRARQVRRVLDPVVEFRRVEALGGAVLLGGPAPALGEQPEQDVLRAETYNPCSGAGVVSVPRRCLRRPATTSPTRTSVTAASTATG